MHHTHSTVGSSREKVKGEKKGKPLFKNIGATNREAKKVNLLILNGPIPSSFSLFSSSTRYPIDI